MKRLSTVSLIVLYSLFLNACLSPCFSSEQTQSGEDKFINGKISYVDFVGSSVTIEFSQPNGDNDEVDFFVNQHTRIVKGNLKLSIAGLKVGDEVIVKYHDTPGTFTSLKADYINIKPLK